MPLRDVERLLQAAIRATRRFPRRAAASTSAACFTAALKEWAAKKRGGELPGGGRVRLGRGQADRSGRAHADLPEGERQAPAGVAGAGANEARLLRKRERNRARKQRKRRLRKEMDVEEVARIDGRPVEGTVANPKRVKALKRHSSNEGDVQSDAEHPVPMVQIVVDDLVQKEVQVPMVQKVQMTVESSQVQFIDRVVDDPVQKEVHAPLMQKVQKTVPKKFEWRDKQLGGPQLQRFSCSTVT